MTDIDSLEVDHYWMTQALVLAERAAVMGEVPVGALVVVDGHAVGEGWNQPISQADPTAHAELMALRAAANHLQNYRLPGSTLYVTLEPCTMCVGAIVHARVERVVFAASEPKAGVVCSRARLLEADYLNHQVTWQGGVCAEASTALLQSFFRQRREAKKQAREAAKNSE